MPEHKEKLEEDSHHDGIEPEPPGFIKNIKWLLLYWRRSLKYLAIGLLIFGLYFLITHRESILEFFPEKSTEKQNTFEPEPQKKPPIKESKTKPPQEKPEKPKSQEEKTDRPQKIPSFISGPVLSESEGELLLELMGSFQNVTVSGSGSLNVTFSTNKKIARYERIFFESDQINTTLYGRFKTTSDFKEKLVKLNMKIRIFMETKHPSRDLSILPMAGGAFKVENFFTSHCQFSCYQLKITGDWNADVEGKKRSGKIDSAFTGRGLGADTHSEVDLTSYPEKVILENFRWHGNSGGTEIPPLVDEIIEEIPIKVAAHRVNTGNFLFEQMGLLAQK